MFKVAQDKLNLEQQVTGGGNGMVYLIIINCISILFIQGHFLYFLPDDEEPDKKTMAQLLKISLGIEDVSS